MNLMVKLAWLVPVTVGVPERVQVVVFRVSHDGMLPVVTE
jgi:hypothetical protein